MPMLIDGVVIPTDEEIRATPAPWFDHDRARFRQVLRNAVAEVERQERQAEYIRKIEEHRRQYPVLKRRQYAILKDGILYIYFE